MKLYIIGTGKDGLGDGDGIYHLLTEEGEALASHLCTNSGFAKSDLLLRRSERIKKYKERFGEITLLFLGDDETTLEELQKLNEKFYKNHNNEKMEK